MPSLYDYPAYYDLVMNRPAAVVSAEVATLCSIFARHGIPPAQDTGCVLELACGMCAHGIPLAQHGYQVTGIDAAAPMLAAAHERADAVGVTLTTIHADVIDFSLTEPSYDAAIFMFETFPLIAAEADIRRHFATVRRHLRKDGVYVVDIDAGLCVHADSQGEWGRREIPLDDGKIILWHEDHPGDWIEGVNRLTLYCHIESGDLSVTTQDDWTIRKYNPWILQLLTQSLDGWQLEGCYAWDTGAPVQRNDAHYFCVFLAI